MSRILQWAKTQREHWVETVERMEAGEMFTSEVRSGKRVDTTRETIDERKTLISKLDDLLTQHDSNA